MLTIHPLFVSVVLVASCATATIAQATDDVLFHFTADWCQPCKEMGRSMEQLSSEGWLIRQIDVDREKELVQRWQVTQLPTLIVLREGRELDRIVGLIQDADLRQRLPKRTGLRPESPRSASQLASDANPEPRIPAVHEMGAKNQSIQPISSTKTGSSSLSSDPMQSTVRIKIEDGASTAFGSGTIIDQYGDEALVLTCGHLFRELHAQSQISVDVFVDGRLTTLPATVVDYRCDDTDIGLIAFRPGRSVAIAPLLPRGVNLREQEKVCSYGCDQGADPTRRDSHITKLNRYLGPANVEVARAPIQGRSGGGLFNSKGELIGVCYAADGELDEGLYSGPEVVYQQLARLGLERLYHAHPSPTPVTPSSSTASSAPWSRPNPAIAASPDLGSRDHFPDQSAGDGWKMAAQQAAQAARDSAASAVAAIAQQSDGATLTAIFRDATGNEQRLTIPSPSPALLQALQMQASPTAEPRMAAR